MFPVRRNLGYRPVEHIGHDGNPVFIGIHVFQHLHEPVPVRGKIVKRVIRVEQESTWDKTLPYLFPFTVTFQDSTNSYIYPRVSGYYFPSLLLNIILTIVTFVVYRKEKSYGKYLAGIITLFTGIAGFITVCLFARIRK